MLAESQREHSFSKMVGFIWKAPEYIWFIYFFILFPHEMTKPRGTNEILEKCEGFYFLLISTLYQNTESSVF